MQCAWPVCRFAVSDSRMTFPFSPVSDEFFRGKQVFPAQGAGYVEEGICVGNKVVLEQNRFFGESVEHNSYATVLFRDSLVVMLIFVSRAFRL